MFSVESLGQFNTIKGKVFAISSPVSSTRSQKSMLDAIGDEIMIDGSRYKPVAFEMFAIGADVRIGEKIGVLVK